MRTSPKPPQLPTTGEAIREARRRAGLSQYQLATKSGLHPATISLAERGTRVSATTREKIAAALGVEPEELRP